MSEKNDEVLAQLQEIMKELKEAKEQNASALAVEHRRKTPLFGSFPGLGEKRRYKIFFFLFVIAFIGMLIGVGSLKNYFTAEPIVEKGSFIESMKELSSLASSQALVKAVIEKEDNQLFGKEIKTNFPGTKRKLLLVVPGTVTAGVDLQSVTEGQVEVDEVKKNIVVTLPHASIIQEPSLEFEQVQAFSVEGIFRAEVDWEEAFELASEAKVLIKEEAISQGLLQMAEKNAEKTLKEFFSQLGYEVTIVFKD